MFHLDKSLVELMGKAGCFRISVGLESFENSKIKYLPSQKQEAKRRFDELLYWCKDANIQLNCFVIIGLPETSVAGTQWMIEYLLKAGVRIRPTIYSDYSMIHSTMTEDEATKILSRHFLPDNAGYSPEERLELYKLAFNLNSVSR
jgi:coproporphyrinogen III oxidase-like Fe-S oxidoreductase